MEVGKVMKDVGIVLYATEEAQRQKKLWDVYKMKMEKLSLIAMWTEFCELWEKCGGVKKKSVIWHRGLELRNTNSPVMDCYFYFQNENVKSSFVMCLGEVKYQTYI